MQRKWLISLVVVLVLGSVFLLWRWQADRDVYEEQIARLKDENLELRQRLEALEEDPDEEPDGEGDAPRPMWSLEALEHHPQVEQMKVRGEEAGYSPGSTVWQPAVLEIPPQMAEAAASAYEDPGSLLMDLAETLRFHQSLGRDVWELTSRVFIDGEEAVGIIMFWGFKDDSVAGTDYRVHMELEGGRWFITATEQRHHCWRGLTEDQIMCL